MHLNRMYAEFVIVLQIILCLKTPLSAGHEDGEHHEKSTDKRHLLGHLGDWLDLDGQALRHIEDHLQILIDSRDDIKDIADGDNSKGLFYFFKIHDYDSNDKLDGLEWFKALTDYHDVSQKQGGEEYDDTEVETMIDDLLRKHDLDQDGYISFSEMINNKPDSLFNELDRMDEAEQSQLQNDEHDKTTENDNQDKREEQENIEKDYQQHGQDQQNIETEYQQNGQDQQNIESESQDNEQDQQNVVETENQDNEHQQQNTDNQDSEIKVIDSQENEHQNERVIDSQEF